MPTPVIIDAIRTPIGALAMLLMTKYATLDL